MACGLSFLMGLKAAGLFTIFTLLITNGFTLFSLPLLYASLVSLLVSLASHPWINLPTVLGKNRDGSFPIWSLIIFSPYLYFVRWVAALKRLKRREVPYTEVYAGHGRGVAVMCALLVALGVVDDVENAAKLIREKRPSIRMHSPLFRKALEEWSENRLPLILKPEPIHTVD